MKSQNSKKPNLKISLDKKQIQQSVKQDKPLSSKCSQNTISSNGKTTASSKQLYFKFQDNQSTANPSFISEIEKKSLDPDQQQLIQLLIQENLQLQKESSDKDTIISELITNKKQAIPQRANTSQTERNSKKCFQIKKLQPNTCDKKQNSPLGFTFCNVDEIQQERVIQSQSITRSQKGLPDVFQVVYFSFNLKQYLYHLITIPKQKKFFI